MALHCFSNSSVWSNDFICPKDRGYCETNVIVPTCICNKGFRHDTTMGRYRDCRVPMAYYPAMDGSLIAISILVFIFTLTRIKGSKSLARLILYGCIGLECLTMLLGTLRFADDHIETGRSLIIYGFNFTFAAVVSYLMTYSLAWPLHNLSKVPVEVFGNQLKILFLIFRIILFTPIIIGASLYDDYTNPLLDHHWNICVLVTSLTCALEIVFLTLINISNSYKLINIFKSLHKSLKISTTTKKPGVDDYITRIQDALKVQLITVPFTFIICMLIPVVYFATGYFPHLYIILTVINLAFPVTALMGTRYASTSSQKAAFASSSESKQQPNQNTTQSEAKQQQVTAISEQIEPPSTGL